MPNVIINWKAEHAYPRLIAALLATTDVKIDMHKIAAVYGQGATYNMIEGRFRLIKREAADLKTAYEKGTTDQTPASATGTTVTPAKKKGPATGTGKRHKVVVGRVIKGGKKGGRGGKGGMVEEMEEEEDEGEGGDEQVGKEEV